MACVATTCVPEGGEEFLVVADEDGVGAHGGEEALGAGVEGVVEFDLAVFVLAVADEDEEVIEGGAEHVDLVEGFEGRGTLELFSLLLGVVLGVEAVFQSILVPFRTWHEDLD
jgi:hypothetical protein